MGIYELSQPPPPVIASSCSSRSKPITYGQRAQRDSSSNVNKPFKSPLPPKAVLPSTSPLNTMTTVLSPVASTSRRPSLTKSDAKSPVKETDNYDPDVEEWQDDMEVEDDESDGESDADLEQVVYVEARMTASTTVLPRVLLGNVLGFMEDYMENNPSLYLGPVDGWQDIRALASHLDAVNVSEIGKSCAGGRKSVSGKDVHFEVYVYRLWNDVDEYISGGTSDDEDEDERGPAAASTKQLPSGELDKLWENLIYPGDIKDRLLDYISSSCCFAEQAIDPRVVSHNRLILLHGPPGTGKTSLCRALAQKISIRLSAQYAETKLVEINSHSLFSKWFSESGKLVQKLFTHVTDMVDGESTFVVVMIDEVESLTAARSAGGSEPGDAMRVVNALLTQLDKLKTRKNVLVVTTSNLSHAIDPAFIDRADMKEYVPLPPPEAIYWMLRSCFTELMDKKIMRRLTLYDWVFANREYGKTKDRESAQHLTNGHVSKVNGSEKRSKDERSIELAAGLVELAITCHGYKMSGRVLRRMPLMAHVRYLAGRQSTTIIARTPERWLEAMNKFVEDEQTDRAKIGWDKQDMATQ